MGYLYDTHVHTVQGSACASATGAQHARGYKAQGYAGIVITDHFYNGNTAVDQGLPWEQWVDAFCAGYEDARAQGEKIGLDVFFGWESGYHGAEFLIFGLDKAWLKAHPDIPDWTVQQQYERVHAAGGLVIQAHPFREAFYIPQVRVYPDWVD
ncbi:MAG: histidinol-phosphatase, partial [Eubacteriales bacterium]|nr:histidinol-phosphatase [Eubacteriales bacterium]